VKTLDDFGNGLFLHYFPFFHFPFLHLLQFAEQLRELLQAKKRRNSRRQECDPERLKKKTDAFAGWDVRSA